MLTWTEKPNIYNSGVDLTAKSGNATILTAEVGVSLGQQYAGPAGTIHSVRIRSIWNRKEKFYSHNYIDDFAARLPVNYGGTPIESVDEVKKYCEERWQEWLDKAGLIQVKAL